MTSNTSSAPGPVAEDTGQHLVSTAEFTERALALNPQIAVFDCDGTLWSGDAGSSFMRWTIDTGLLSPERTVWLDRRYEGYRRGEVSELAICGEMVQVYAGLPIAELRQAAATFFQDHIEANIFPELAALLGELTRRGTEIWAVSSTCDWVIEEGVRRFGITPANVLAARVEVEDGRATDRLLDVPTDEGKVASLRRMGVFTPDAVFGNSVHDAAMLRLARTAFAVNPTPQLVQEASRRGWPMYFPGAVRQRQEL